MAAGLSWHTGDRPGLADAIAALHGRYYAAAFGFGPVFERQVADGLAAFVPRLARPGNGLWSVARGDALLGSVAIDGEAAGDTSCAKLRWFIVDGAARGLGLGGRLLQQAVAFCDAQRFARTELATFAGLDAARHLYERQGFVLTQEHPGTTWGTRVLEQHFVRPAGAALAPA